MSELKQAGYTAFHLKRAGYTATDLKGDYRLDSLILFYSRKQLINAGFSVSDINMNTCVVCSLPLAFIIVFIILFILKERS